MAARAYWSGQLKISLVSFGIDLFSATKPQATITFHQLDRKSGQRVRHLNVVDDNKPVEPADIVKGYEYSKGEYVYLEPNELTRLRIPTKRVIDVKQFVDLAEIDPKLFETPYFVVPQAKESGNAFAVVRHALQQTRKAAIGEIAFAGREHLVAITVPKEQSFKGLMAYTLRYGEELREGQEYMPDDATSDVDKKELDMAAELIRSYSAPLQLSKFKDDYEAAVRELVEAKEKNIPLPREEKQPKRAKVTDLMDALRRSVTEANRSGTEGKSSPARQKQRPAAKDGPVLVKANSRKRNAA